MITRIPEGEPRAVAVEDRSLLKPSNFALRCREVRMIPLNRIALAVGGAFFILAINLGSVQGAGLVSFAETPTPPRTPTMVATLNPIQKQIAALQATAVALRQQKEDEKKLADARATVNALEATPTTTPTPIPVRSPAEATATADTIRLGALGREQAAIKATATARAEQTATAEANKVATVQARETAAATTKKAAERKQEEGIPAFIVWEFLVLVGIAGFFYRKTIARVINKIRKRFGGGAGPAAGGGTP